MASLGFALDIVLNLSLLVSLTILSDFLDRRLSRRRRAGAVAQGLLFGAVAILGMLRPVTFGPGLFFDGRSIMVSLCAFFFGPFAALPAVLLTAGVRLAMGGVGAVMGLLVVLSSAGIGLVARAVRDPERRPPTPLTLFLFGLAVHAAMLLCALSLPDGSGPAVIARIGPGVIGLYPLATILAGKILADQVIAQSAREALGKSEERFQLSMEATNDGLWDLDVATDYSYYSPAYYRMLGYEPGDFPTTGAAWREQLHPEDLERALRANEECIEGRTDFIDIEYRLRARDGSWRWIHARGKCITRDARGRAARIVGTHIDVTARKEAEAVLERNLREKETLLREVHHRVKNNLGVISSLLSLQSSMIKDEAQAMRAFEESRERIEALAFVHEEIYRSGDSSSVDMAEYLMTLASRILQSEGRRPDVRLESDMGGVLLPMDRAIPCGLIIHELLSNAYRHAFPARAGRVRVALAPEGAEYVLSVSDDGIGLPPGAEEGAASLGFTLVRTLVRQLDGTLELSRTGGTSVLVRFPALD